MTPANDVSSMDPEDTNHIAAAGKEKKNKKKSGAFGLFKAALSMMRKSHKERPPKNPNPTPTAAAANANWTKLVDSVRPLHSQEIVPSPPPSENSEVTESVPASPAPSSSAGAGTMSQYASAMSLRDLVDYSDDEEEEDPDEVFDAVCGDEMIDAKAEEFIAQFYQQLRLQNTNNVHRRRH